MTTNLAWSPKDLDHESMLARARIEAWTEEYDPQRRRIVDRRLVHKTFDENVFVARAEKLSGADATVLAELVIDPTHAYFFEHHRDHLPGMYLIEAARQLGMVGIELLYPTASERAPVVVDGIDVRFHRFAELDRPLFGLLKFPRATIFAGELAVFRDEVLLLQSGETVGQFHFAGRLIDAASYGELRRAGSQRR